MKKPKKTCIIGSSGFLGRYFTSAYQKHYDDLFSTCYKTEDSKRFLDLSNPKIDHLPENYTFALIAAGCTKIAYCEQKKKKSWKCNVDGTLKIASDFHSKGIRPIVFSTDHVFDGKNGGYSDDAPLSPLTEYGRQKAELEMRVQEVCKGNCLIIRLSKVFSLKKGDGTLLDEMASSLMKNQTILAAHDQIFCPILIDDVIKAVFELQNANAKGVFNICGKEIWSRYGLAKTLALNLDVDASLVKRISLDELAESFTRPKITDMRMDRFTQESKMAFTSVVECIDKIASNYHTK